MMRFALYLLAVILALYGVVQSSPSEAQAILDSFNMLRVESENRCAEYDRDDYSYSQSLEPKIVESQGGMFSPYDGTCFDNLRESDIEHIVATSEAHDSGMCNRSREEKGAYASDLLNLTLATPRLNRHQKGAKDFADWQPEHNLCWYAARIVEVKSMYGLSVDQSEKDALVEALNNCINSGTTLEIEAPQCSTGTSVENARPYTGFRVPANYPNPVDDHTTFMIDSPVQTVVSIQLLDVLGREVFLLPNVFIAAGEKQYIRLTSLDMPPGIYLYQITAESGANKTGKLIKK